MSSNIKNAIFASFDYIDGALFDGKEFFDLKGKFPIAFTMWTYKSKKNESITNTIELRDLTWVRKKNLCEIDWNNCELVDTKCKEIIFDKKSIKIPFGIERTGIKEWSNIKRKDLIRARRKNEINNLYCGGLPKSDDRLKNNSVYGFYKGDSIGFMEDLTPCRTVADIKNVPWFTLDARFQRVRRNRCFSGPPDSRGYCAVDYLSAKKLFLWYALAKTFVDFSPPMWTDAMEIWVPSLLNKYDPILTCYSFAIGLADNDCVETTFPSNNPVSGLIEIHCTNPMSPNNSSSFWSVFMKKIFLDNDNKLISDLVDSVIKLYLAWKNKFKLNPEIKVTYACAYFIGNGILTPNSGIKQIKDYVRENPDEQLSELIDNLNKLLKRTKEAFFSYLLSENLINYFGSSEEDKTHFDSKEKRLLLASTIVNRLCDSKNFGRTKFAKVFYIADMICKEKLDTTYHREAAGPIDYKFLYDPKENIELVGAKRDYFYTDTSKNKIKYYPGRKNIEINKYYADCFSEQTAELERLFNLFYNLNTVQSEIVATLYACWNDLLIMRQEISDQLIISEVKKHWHINKLRFSDDRLLTALNWMKENKLLPKGNKEITKQKSD